MGKKDKREKRAKKMVAEGGRVACVTDGSKVDVVEI